MLAEALMPHAIQIRRIDISGELSNQEPQLKKSSMPRDWRRILGRWVARAYVYAAAAAARREGHVETLSQSSKRPVFLADMKSLASLACACENLMAASRHAYLGVERISMAGRLIHVFGHAMLSLASISRTGSTIGGA